MLQRRLILASMLLPFVSGCLTLNKKTLGDFHLSGRFSLQYLDDTHSDLQGEQGRFDLSSDPRITMWSLDAPTGQTIAELAWDASDKTTLRRLKEKDLQSDHPDLLASQLFGWPLPIVWLTACFKQHRQLLMDQDYQDWRMRVLERFPSGGLVRRMQLEWLVPQPPIKQLTLIFVFDPPSA